MCKHPFWNSNEQFWCPCGSCPYCRRQRVKEWSLRVLHELMSYPPGTQHLMIRLSYDPEHCPKDYSLIRKDLQLFMKRLRSDLDYKIRFFACGEYGERRHRPHYHAIIFGMKHSDALKIEKNWKLGSVHIGYRVGMDTGGYVAGYVTKKLKKKFYGKRTPPFIQASQGIGRAFVDKFSTVILEKGYCEVATSKCKYAIPRYYFKRLGIDRREYYAGTIKDKNIELLSEIVRQVGADKIVTREEFKRENNYVHHEFKHIKSKEILDDIEKGWYIQIDNILYVLKAEAKAVLRNMRRAKSLTIEAQLKERMDL